MTLHTRYKSVTEKRSIFSIQSSIISLQEDDVIGLLNSTDISELKPLADRILIQVFLHREASNGGCRAFASQYIASCHTRN